MKKFCAVFLLFVIAVVFTAVWFSPLAAIGSTTEYCNNAPISYERGIVYNGDNARRVDFDGSEGDMYAAIKKLGGRVVKTEYAGGRTIVYAFSSRAKQTEYGYNIMGAYADGHICIGSPVLCGSY